MAKDKDKQAAKLTNGEEKDTHNRNLKNGEEKKADRLTNVDDKQTGRLAKHQMRVAVSREISL